MFKNDFFASNWEFDESELNMRSKFQMVNIAIILSSSGLVFGIIINCFKGVYGLIILETALFIVNVSLFFLLRFLKKSLNFVAIIETLQFTFLFIFLLYTNEPASLKHIWIFTYPIVLLYFQNEKNATYWVAFMVFMLLIAPLQPFVKVSYSMFQVTYLSFVLVIISIIIYFYQKKIDEAKKMILRQQAELKIKVQELTQKDKLLTIQSKQAVMGEMISMIAHQWRQPLSTVTLNISNIQVKKLLGEEVDDALLYKTLKDISDTIMYLSDTIDDFQTYFKPNKEITIASIDFLIKKAINFTEARIKATPIKIYFDDSDSERIETYANELIQVILNIINNAIDELLILNILNPHITIEIVEKPNSFEINIEDNAHGIIAEDIEQIFEPYFSTKGKNGTGLGLYMSQMIMQKQFNSKIEVHSSSTGSIFTINVPKKLS